MEHSCKNCDTAFTGKYCNACGQEWKEGRHSLGSLIRARFGEFWHDLEMLWKTTLGLLLRPGTVIREYLAGKHKTWYNAINYFLVAGSLTAAVTLLRAEAHPEELARIIEGYRQFYDQAGMAYTEESLQFLGSFILWVQQNYSLILLAAMPFLGLASWLTVRRGYLLGEHLILHFYAYGCYNLLSLPIDYLFDPMNIQSGAYIIAFPFYMAYYVWVFRQFFQISWGQSIWRVLLMQVVYFASFMLFVAVATFITVLGIFAWRQIF